MRDHIAALLRPKAEELVEQLVAEALDIIMRQVGVMVGQLELAFDVAASTFASDVLVTDGAARQHDVRDDEGESRSATQPRSRAISRPVDNRSARGSRGEHEQHASDAAASEPSSGRAATNVSSSYRALQQGKDLPPSTSSGRPCGCAATGRHKKTCPTQVSTSPASRDSASKTSGAVASTPATSLISSPPPRQLRVASSSSRTQPSAKRSELPATPTPVPTFDLRQSFKVEQGAKTNRVRAIRARAKDLLIPTAPSSTT